MPKKNWGKILKEADRIRKISLEEIFDNVHEVRVPNALYFHGDIETLGQLLEKTADQLLEIKTFGETCLKRLRNRLEELGLKLKGD